MASAAVSAPGPLHASTHAAAGAKRGRRVLFQPAPDRLRQGVFEDTEVNAAHDGITLTRGPGGSHRPAGSYLSQPVSIKGMPSLRLSWRERWTTPLAWEKHPRNPILGPPPPGNWDAGSLTTPSLLRAADEFRLYYGSRPRGSKTAVGMAAAPLSDPHRWKKHPKPVLTAGAPGAFDENGVIGPEVVPVTDTHWHMYYVGYHPTAKQGRMPVHQIGLAESDDGGLTWRRSSNEAVVPHGPAGSYDAFSASSCSVLRVGKQWMMWYGGIAQVPYLASVCLATSEDGHSWKKFERNPVLSFNPYLEAEAFLAAAPHVLHEDGLFKMWYSAKGYGEGRKAGDYRICYAESRDGILWDRFPKNPVVGPSAAGWDSKMAEYPEVLHVDGEHHMWYCGDGYGSLGYAKGRTLARVRIQTRTGNTKSPDASWSGWSDPHPDPTGSEVKHETAAFLQIRAGLETEDRDFSPAVQDITLTTA